MSKKLSIPASRHHLMIYDEDRLFLLENFGPGTEANLQWGIAAREMIHKRIMFLRERQNEALSARASSPQAQAEAKAQAETKEAKT